MPHLSSVPGLSNEEIEKMTPKKAESRFYFLQGLCVAGDLEKKIWFGEDKKYANTIIKLLERSGKTVIGHERHRPILG